MRTTVDIPDKEYRLLKSRAAAERTTVKAMVLRGVEVVLNESGSSPRRRLQLPLLKSKRPGSLEIDNERVYDILGFP